MSKRILNLDERGIGVIRQISTVLYVITLYSLIAVQLYRQFALHQPTEEWNDIAIIIAFNVIVWIGAVLYLTGLVNPRNVKLRYLIAGFIGFVLIGFAFTVFKYSVLLQQKLVMRHVLDYLLIVIKVCSFLVISWGLIAYLGNLRMEKRIE